MQNEQISIHHGNTKTIIHGIPAVSYDLLTSGSLTNGRNFLNEGRIVFTDRFYTGPNLVYQNILNEGRIIFTDRFYTGPNLMYPMAKVHQTFWIGTVTSTTKSFLPKEIMKGSPTANSLPRGHTVWRFSADGKRT